MNHNQITALKPKSKTYKKGLGNGFFVEVHKVYKNKSGEQLGGRKYFKGRVKGQEVNVGVFGHKAGEISLKDAREKFTQIKNYCQKNEISYADYKREKNREKLSAWTLTETIDYFLDRL